ncbi:hypothetical protein QR680_003501 [Steinernema hermaphroditum]|uniref:CWH43-like N-terminal domain-containing protein n=1 Tax=Steinernema hermaphroditum TaxID=289476 RepID=A0AA39LSG4_9BILA|nr:hypothetical protein QR680_003501 [Steinernema hermaphroditum]
MTCSAIVVGTVEKRTSRVLLSLSSKVYIVVTVTPVVLALLLSFFIGFGADYDTLLNYEWTCGKALLPSISRIINLPKERTVCNLLVLFHVVLRPLITAHYYNICRQPTYTAKHPIIFLLLLKAIPLSSFAELAFTIALTVVGERENPNLHVVFFCGFCVSTNLYLLLVTVLFRFSRHYSIHDNAPRSFKIKTFLVAANFLLLPSISIFFVLYWQFCVKFAYNVFALLEYATVFTMLSYHSTAYMDINLTYKLIATK